MLQEHGHLQTNADRPYAVLFASSIASASSANVWNMSTGPNVDVLVELDQELITDRLLDKESGSGETDLTRVIELPRRPVGCHYLTMIGALGGRNCALTAEQFGEYEAVAGTGQAHLWFDIA